MSIVESINKLWWHDGHLNEDQRDFLIKLLENHRPKHCIEVGFATGRSTITTLLAAKPEILVSIDIDLDYMGARSHAEDLLKKFNNLTIIEGDSSVIINHEFFNKYFSKGIDFAFIDGTHTYLGALSDIEKIYTQMKSGGIIVIDDYLSGPPNGCSIPDVDNAVYDFAASKKLKIDKWYCSGKGFAIIKT